MCNSSRLIPRLTHRVDNVPPPALGRIFNARLSGRHQCVSQFVSESLSARLLLHLQALLRFFLNSSKRNLFCRNTLHGMFY